MAYIVMAYIVIAYIVMAYIVTAYTRVHYQALPTMAGLVDFLATAAAASVPPESPERI